MASQLSQETLTSTNEARAKWQCSLYIDSNAPEVPTSDMKYAVFIGVLSLFPALIIANISSDDVLYNLQRFFSVPIDYVINGLLMSVLLYGGSHFNKKAKSYPFAFHVTLQILSLNPLLELLHIFRWGTIPILIIYGALLVRAAHRIYGIPTRNASLLFGTIYIMFAILQIQRI